MQPYPHTYAVSATSRNAGYVRLSAPQLPDLQSAAPPQFGGPGGVWSPETLLCAALADCFVLTFHSISRAARFAWISLECRVDGMLDSPERVSQFTHFTTTATLTVSAGSDHVRARELLERAEQGCLIANSLRGARSLQIAIVVEPARAAAAG